MNNKTLKKYKKTRKKGNLKSYIKKHNLKINYDVETSFPRAQQQKQKNSRAQVHVPMHQLQNPNRHP